ncbi:hypothetical protein NJ76_31395 [Rhodococcus sp. IITR03]|nr:hypothetical protein NJ76_31395 [Rhodococcus sp. IITR03]
MEGAKTVDQAVTVLMVLEKQPLSVSQVSEMTGLNRTVVHRMLATLHDRGFVRRELDRYSLGAVFVRFATKIEPALLTATRPAMQELSDATGETVVLSVADHLDVVAIAQCAGRVHPLRVEYEIGSRRPITKGAGGRAILAYHDKALVERALRTVPNPADQMEALAQTREKGYAETHDELHEGLDGVAAPLWLDGKVVASLSVIVPAQRGRTMSAHLESLLRAADAATAALGGLNP